MASLELVGGSKLLAMDNDSVFSVDVTKVCSIEEFAMTLPSFRYVKPPALDFASSRALFPKDTNPVVYSIMPSLAMMLPLKFYTEVIDVNKLNGDGTTTTTPKEISKAKIYPRRPDNNGNPTYSTDGMEGLFFVNLVPAPGTVLMVVLDYITQTNTNAYVVLLDTNTKRTYSLPFPNVYSDGRICMGATFSAPITIDKVMDLFIEVFQNAPPNTDLWDSTKNDICASCLTITPEMNAVLETSGLVYVTNCPIEEASKDFITLSTINQ